MYNLYLYEHFISLMISIGVRDNRLYNLSSSLRYMIVPQKFSYYAFVVVQKCHPSSQTIPMVTFLWLCMLSQTKLSDINLAMFVYTCSKSFPFIKCCHKLAFDIKSWSHFWWSIVDFADIQIDTLCRLYLVASSCYTRDVPMSTILQCFWRQSRS